MKKTNNKWYASTYSELEAYYLPNRKYKAQVHYPLDKVIYQGQKGGSVRRHNLAKV